LRQYGDALMRDRCRNRGPVNALGFFAKPLEKRRGVRDFGAGLVDRLAALDKYLGGFEADQPETYGVSPIANAGGLEALRSAARAVRVEPAITAYITAIVRATRDAASLTLGASPRAGISLLKTSRALARLEGRDYVIPDDVKSLAPAALRHRVAVAPELELEGVSADAALKAILDRIEVPEL
jgi:MoxR-like ATPase